MHQEKNYCSEFDLLLNLVAMALNSVSKTQVPANQAWRNDIHVLAIKMFKHLTSIRTIAQGTQLEFHGDLNVEFVDHASVTVLVRTCLETYLAMHHIGGDSDDAICEFRHLAWRLAGLTDRQKIVPLTPETKAKHLEEAALVTSLREELVAHPLYLAITDADQQGKLRTGTWRTKSWPALAIDAGFESTYIKKVYNYLSGHSHASFISAIQTQDAQTIADQNSLAQGMISVAVKIMAEFVSTYQRIFPVAQETLAKHPGAMKSIRKWLFTAEEFKNVQESMQLNSEAEQK